jgi:ATP/ADP translocase
VAADNLPPEFPSKSMRGSGAADNGTTQSLVRHLLSGSAFGIRPGEGGTAWLLFVYFFLLATIHSVGESVRDSTYIASLGATKLPLAYLAVALGSFPVLILYARVSARFSQRFLIVSWAFIHAVGLLTFYWLFDLDSTWVPLAFYLWTAIAFGIGLSQYWSYANHRLDPRQARRLFAFIGAGVQHPVGPARGGRPLARGRRVHRAARAHEPRSPATRAPPPRRAGADSKRP